MRFACERCGKKYATAEEPAPGRVYKLKCKACGHLIVVKASAPAPTAAAPAAVPAAARAPAAEPPPILPESPPLRAESPPIPDAPPPIPGESRPISAEPPAGALEAPPVPASAGIEIGAPEAVRGPENGAAGPNSFDATTQVSTPAMAGQDELEHVPSQGGPAGYVDLFSDVSGLQEPPQKASEDPFLSAARASLPDGYGVGSPAAPDPLATLREGVSATSEPHPTPRAARHVPKVPFIPKPKQGRSNVPLVLIGAGVAVLVGILAFVLLSSAGKQVPAPAPTAVATSAAPPAAPPAAPVAAPAPPEMAQPAPAAAAPEKTDDAERRARAEQRRKQREEAQAREDNARTEREARDREAKAQAGAARDAKERSRQAPQEPTADKAAAEPEDGLTQAQIEGVLRSTKPAFDGCMQAARGTNAALDGRRVLLRLSIQTTGAVTHPTLDDAALNDTEFGTCLKSAARLMVFPKFKGDTMRVEVPLVMR